MTDSITIRDAVFKNPALAFDLNQNGVDFIAEQYKPLKDFYWYKPKNNSSSNQVFRTADYNRLGLGQIVDVLVESHHDYVKQRIPFIESILKKLAWTNPSLKALSTSFSRFKNELLEHIEYEEINLFPYLIKIEHLSLFPPANYFILAQLCDHYSLEEFIENDSSIEDEFEMLTKEMYFKINPIKDQLEAYVVLAEIESLKNDLERHARLENEILLIKAEVVEENLYALIDGALRQN